MSETLDATPSLLSHTVKFEVRGGCETRGPRRGALMYKNNGLHTPSAGTSRDQTVQTPALLVHTMGGSLPSLTPDLAATLPVQLAHIDISEVLSFAPIAEQGAAWSALPEHCLTMLSVASMLSVQNDSEKTQKGITVETSNGRKLITPQQYLSVADALRPHVVIGLSEECLCNLRTPGEAKRAQKAMDRAAAWLEECVRPPVISGPETGLDSGNEDDEESIRAKKKKAKKEAKKEAWLKRQAAAASSAAAAGKVTEEKATSSTTSTGKDSLTQPQKAIDSRKANSKTKKIEWVRSESDSAPPLNLHPRHCFLKCLTSYIGEHAPVQKESINDNEVDVLNSVCSSALSKAPTLPSTSLRREDIYHSILAGAAIGGLGLGESPAERTESIIALRHSFERGVVSNMRSIAPASLNSSTSSSATPQSLSITEAPLRVAVKGFTTPKEILQAIKLGVDVIGSAYPYILAKDGRALCLPISTSIASDPSSITPEVQVPLQKKRRLTTESGSSSCQMNIANSDDLPSHLLPDPRRQVLDLRDATMRTDRRPLVPGCGCYACQAYTRSYVHHLLLAHEMLGDILLQLHNMHQLLAFFEAARQHLDNGTFSEFCSRIEDAV